MVKQQDQIYASPLDQIIDFQFDEKVVNVFPDMIQRSVPGYSTLISTIGVMASHYAQTNSQLYDLGCSLGAVSLSMRQRLEKGDYKIVAVDNSSAMLEQASALLNAEKENAVPVELLCDDIQNIDITNASVVVMNFTLQFIPVADRLALLNKIYQGLNPGGVLILSEKLAFSDEAVDDFHIATHHDFKRSNGYSDLEISQKRSALENVLIPETLDTHKERLQQAGFNFVEQWFQCFNFVSIAAVKQ
jgi:tRNA (cmo5U34)-methyltransferase